MPPGPTNPQPDPATADGDGDAAENAASDSPDSSSDSSDEDMAEKPQAQRQNKVASDDEDEPANSTAAAATAHEIVKPPVSMLEITEVDPSEAIVHIGEVMSIIDSVVVVKGLPQVTVPMLHERVLDTESLLVFEDRTVLGQLFETFGPLKQPMYSVRFPDNKSIDQQRITISKAVYHVPGRSFFVSTASLHTKGSDASNFYDEEPGVDEVEFSDDEQEIEHRRAVNAQ
ncbi:Gar1/Naf1 RNA binding region-domain-containing protein [Auriculariales sp. MPI-PUGE-AT-0066]|nr:Gar1/Naf1 RNA binding region-domain-containing protein [Auriculariales sp. MPI-PUGE-AT-0066]